MTSLPHSRLGILKHLKRLAISEHQRERSLLKWNLILADRDDIIASLKVRHLKVSEDTGYQIGVFCNEASFLLLNMTSLLPSELVSISRAAYR